MIQQTYRANGDEPVELVGHSNGPLYAQYLLTHTSRSWRRKYIHGFTPIAGNFPGQGSVYSIMFTGLNIENFSYPATHANAVSSARMFLSSPASYMSSADPAVFGNREVVVKDAATGVKYTPADYQRLFKDAHLHDALQIARHYIGFVKFADRADFPGRRCDSGAGFRDSHGRRCGPAQLGGGAGGDAENGLLQARRGHQPGGHHQHRDPHLEGHAVLPVQPH